MADNKKQKKGNLGKWSTSFAVTIKKSVEQVTGVSWACVLAEIPVLTPHLCDPTSGCPVS